MPTISSKRKYIAPIIAILIICGLAVSIYMLRGYSPYVIKSSLVGNPQIVLALEDVEIVGRSDGQKTWSFAADKASVSRGRYRTEFISIRDGKLFDNNKVVASVSAGKAVYDASTGNVEVSKGVKVASIHGYKAEADKALWSAYLSQLRCPGTVKLTSEESSLVGQDLLLDARNRDVTLKKAKLVVSVSEIP